MSIEAGRAKLVDNYKKLFRQWQDTKSKWRDKTANEFEKEHLEPLEQMMRSALGAMDQMQESLQKAKRDCS